MIAGIDCELETNSHSPTTHGGTGQDLIDLQQFH